MSESQQTPSLEQIREQILQVTRDLLKELGAHEALGRLHLQASFEEDLGLKSFDLVELLIRVETAVGVKLPDHIAEQAGTPAEWAAVVLASADFGASSSASLAATHRDAPPPPRDARNLVEALLRHSEIEPDRIHARFPHAPGRRDLVLSEVVREASLAAGALIERGVEPGETVALLLANGPDFLITFLGIQMSGAIPVVLNPPEADGTTGEYLRAQVRILEDTKARLIIASEYSATTRLFRRHVSHQTFVSTPRDLLKGARPPARTMAVSPIAAILVSAGMEGHARPIPLSHGDILANLRALGEPLGVEPQDSVVSWAPLSSALGLINGWFFSLFYALPLTILDTARILQQPDLWLWTVAQTNATISLAPDSGYDNCSRKAPAGALEGLDLTRWRVAICAGEFVRAGTLRRFAERFSPFGFSRYSFVPAYALTEAAGILLLSPPGRIWLSDQVDRDRLEMRGEVIARNGSRFVEFVSCGSPLAEFEVSLADQNGQHVPQGAVGRLLYRRLGAASVRGTYWGDPAAWQDSGDLAYVLDGEIRVVGRSSDLLRQGDRYVLPQHIEDLVSAVPGIQRRRVAAIQTDGGRGDGPVAVVAETSAVLEKDVERVREQVVQMLTRQVGPNPKVELVRTGQLPRGSLGQVRRSRTRDLLLRGRLGEGRMLGRLALWRMRLEGVLRGTGKLFQRLGKVFLALYYRLLLLTIPATGGVMIRLVGDRRAAGRLLRWTARTVLTLGGHRVPSAAVFEPRREGAHLLVANRAGKYDPLILAATLPRNIVFADQAALAGLPKGVRFLMQPLVLERRPSEGGTRHPDAVTEALRDGACVVLLPECAPGTPAIASRFRLDVFTGALAHRAPITPIGLRDTHGLFECRDGVDQMSMVMGELIEPEGFSPDLAASLRLRTRLSVAAIAQPAILEKQPGADPAAVA